MQRLIHLTALTGLFVKIKRISFKNYYSTCTSTNNLAVDFHWLDALISSLEGIHMYIYIPLRASFESFLSFSVLVF